MTSDQTAIDQTEAARGEAFMERIFAASLATFDVLNIHLGSRLGLYEALAGGGARTPGELAAATSTDERYVREWLEQQAVTAILEVDDVSAEAPARRYSLPAAHAAVLVEQTNPLYMGGFTRLIGSFGPVLPALIEAYRSGEGVPWGAYGEDGFEGQSEFTRPMFANELARDWLPAIPGIGERLTAGEAVRIADIACGCGWAAIEIARAYPNVHVDGFDLDLPSIERARRTAEAEGVADRVTFHAIDAAEAETDPGYDLVTIFEAVHDLPDPVSVLRTARSMVAEGGVVMVADEGVAETFTAPGDDVERTMYGFSTLLCLPNSRAGSPSVATGTVIRPATMRRFALEAGFSDVTVLPIANDFWRFYQLVV